MRRPPLVLLLALFAVGLFARPSLGVSPLRKQFLETYKESKIIKAAEEAKCTVCHYGKTKKNRNDYGKTIAQFFTKADYDKLKSDKAKLAEAMLAALKKAEAKESVSKETFGARIKAGRLPGTAPEQPEEAEK